MKWVGIVLQHGRKGVLQYSLLDGNCIAIEVGWLGKFVLQYTQCIVTNSGWLARKKKKLYRDTNFVSWLQCAEWLGNGVTIQCYCIVTEGELEEQAGGCIATQRAARPRHDAGQGHWESGWGRVGRRRCAKADVGAPGRARHAGAGRGRGARLGRAAGQRVVHLVHSTCF